jgi:UDP-N-acetylmuramate dehydrogenase
MEFKENESLAHHSSFRIGGPAKLYVEAATVADVVAAQERAETEKLPIFVFSGGSNVLFSDTGFPGVVVRIAIRGIQTRGDGSVSVGAGEKLTDLVTAACDAGLSGLERLSGVPGSVGGAIRGNAGAFGTETGKLVASVKAFDRKTGEVRELNRDECGFGYRMSTFKNDPDLIVLSAEFKLSPGHDPESLRDTSEEIVSTREEKHPQDVFSAGSFFMNPVVDDQELREEFTRDAGKPPKDERLPAGWLIDQVGLRGKTIGHAKISEMHPNYILNTGGATAEEVLTLVSIVKQKIRDELNVQMHPEVQFVGFGSEKPA